MTRRADLDSCPLCVEAATFLTSVRATDKGLQPAIRLVDLFAGCGGLSLGVAEAARPLGLGVDIRFAVDVDEDAVAVYRDNFPSACVKQGLVEEFFDGELGRPPTLSEQKVRASVGSVDILVGGPPCQGHSNLNNHTRRDDPRNGLYARMARAAEVLRPTLLLVENVPSVQHDVASVLKLTMEALEAADFKVADGVLDLASLGVPQRRRRHVIVASLGTELDPKAVLDGLGNGPCRHHVRTVRWAISDLVRGSHAGVFDTASTPNKDSIRRINHLFDKGWYDLRNRYRPKCHRSNHSYVSMYGRLRWDEPAQTVTTGFGSMGQGRYVHPSRRRTITPHEAARLQMFPDFFNFTAAGNRGALQRMIGNAVPPPLSKTVVALALPAIQAGRPDLARQVIEYQRSPISANGSGPGPATPSATSSVSGRSLAPVATSDQVRRRMQATRQRDTVGEQVLREALDDIGLRYVVDVRPIAGSRSRADFVVQEARVAVYWDGCFWHSCPQHGTYPKANADWWRDKLAANRYRDVAAGRALREAGWLVLRFWAHEDPVKVATAIGSAVRGRART